MADEKVWDQREAVLEAGGLPPATPSKYATYEDWEKARCPLSNREVQRIVDNGDKLRAENERLRAALKSIQSHAEERLFLMGMHAIEEACEDALTAPSEGDPT